MGHLALINSVVESERRVEYEAGRRAGPYVNYLAPVQRARPAAAQPAAAQNTGQKRPSLLARILASAGLL